MTVIVGLRAERLRKMSEAVQDNYEAGYADIDVRGCSTMNARTLN